LVQKYPTLVLDNYKVLSFHVGHNIISQGPVSTNGSFDIFVEVTDEWGCVDTLKLKGAVKVREKIGARFTSNKPVACDSVTATIQNISRIDKSQVKKITWYWGDGTKTTDWGPTIKHTFYGQGTYNSNVIIETIAIMLIFLLFFLLLSISEDFSYP
jgi:hypothetical protein